MPQITRRRMIALGLAAGLMPGRGAARSVAYRLDEAQSQVGFAFNLSGLRQNGTMPVRLADIHIDPNNLIRSEVDVSLDVSKAKTVLGFATRAMTGPDVLHAAAFPTIRFRSRSVTLGADQRISNGATITGDVTIRDVTAPLTLQADIFRPQGSAPDDLSQLTVNLKGSVSRSQFGAGGYADLVADEVMLDIRAVIGVT